MTERMIFILIMALLGVFSVVCAVVDVVALVRKRRVVKPVEFFAPKGYSPIDVSLVYSARKMKANALYTPLLLYWANENLVTVEEDGRGLKISKLKDLPAFEEGERADQKTYRCEKSLFDKMFEAGDTFYTLAAPKSVNETYEKTVEECKKLSRAAIGKKGNRYSFAMKATGAILVLLIGIVLSIFQRLPIAMVLLFPVIGIFLIKFMPAPFYVRVPFMLVWGGMPLVLAVFLIPMPTLYRIAIASAAAVLFLTVFVFAEYADFRTEEDLKIYGKVCSFKRFLVMADKGRLEALVEDYPDYFYDVLPFFYVFGITKKMRKKFDKIIPDGSMRALGPIRDIYID